jgi:hypothetical protein
VDPMVSYNCALDIAAMLRQQLAAPE